MVTDLEPTGDLKEEQQNDAVLATKYAASSMLTAKTKPISPNSFILHDNGHGFMDRIFAGRHNEVHGTVFSEGQSPLLSEDDKEGATDFCEEKHSALRSVIRAVLKRSLFIKQAIIILLWFVCSFSTVISTRYYLAQLHGDPTLLGGFQLVITSGLSFIGVYLPSKISDGVQTKLSCNVPSLRFLKTCGILGFLRFGMVITGTISLKYVPVSFNEAIKSTAPFFTVVAAYLILGETHGWLVNLSLIPIVSGLAIASVNELSFHLIGFITALANNVFACVQHIFVKKRLSGDEKYSPAELLLYASAAASLVQLPFWIFMDFHDLAKHLNEFSIGVLVANGILTYFQGILAFSLMDIIPPVTFSVANTTKRALNIWLSVLVFGNAISVLSAAGTCIVLLGVGLYQGARHYEAALAKHIKESATE